MKTNMSKKIKAIGVAIVLLGGLLGAGIAGTVQKNSYDAQLDAYQEDTQITLDALQSDLSELQDKLQNEADDNDALVTSIEALNTQIKELEEQKVRDDQVIADYQEELNRYNEEQELENQEQVALENSYVFDEFYLGENIGDTINDNDWSLLQDDEVRFDGDNYDIHDEIFLRDSLTIVTNALGYDEDFGNQPFLITEDKDAIVYSYVFDDMINYSDISNDEPLEINFLGKDYKLVDVSPTEVEFEYGYETFMNEGDSVHYEEHEIVLEMVSDTKVLISVDGVGELIEEGDSDVVNGVEIKITEVLSNDRGGIATLVIGDSVVQELDNGDEFMDMEDYEFNIITDGDNLQELQVVYEPKFKKLDTEPEALAVGNSLNFADFFSLEFSGLENIDYTDYQITLDEVTEQDELTSDQNAVIVESDEDDGIEVDGEETNYVFVTADPTATPRDGYTIYYENDDGDVIKATDNMFTLINDDTEIIVSVDNNGLHMWDGDETTSVAVDIPNLKIGDVEEDAEVNDIKYIANGIGNIDTDVLTPYGIVFESVESNLDNDEVYFSLPNDKVEAVFRLY